VRCRVSRWKNQYGGTLPGLEGSDSYFGQNEGKEGIEESIYVVTVLLLQTNYKGCTSAGVIIHESDDAT